MATKRSPSSSSTAGMPAKRPRLCPADTSTPLEIDTRSGNFQSSSQVDSTYGQRHALPGLDEDTVGDCEEESLEALQYLQSVRTEARAVPKLLIADPRAEELRASDPEQRGWYADGAYTGLPVANGHQYPGAGAARLSPQYADGTGDLDDVDPQEAYYSALLKRFSRFRTSLAKSPLALSSKATKTAQTHAATDLTARQPQWSYALRRTTPSGTQFGTLTQAQVVKGLERIESLITVIRMCQIEECRNLGAWAWALFGRCREVGEMDSDDVGVLRQLGKTALWVTHRIRMRVAEKEQGTVERGNGADGGSEGSSQIEDAYGPNLGEGEETNGQACVGSESNQGLGLEQNKGPEPEQGEATIPEQHQGSEPAQSKGPGPKQNNDSRPDENGDLKPERDASPRPEQNAGIDHGTNGVTAPNVVMEETSDGSEDGEIAQEPAGESIDLEKAKQQLLANIADGQSAHADLGESIGSRHPEEREPDPMDVEARALATLDIIVTIVGELYGQRDLLAAREAWGEF